MKSTSKNNKLLIFLIIRNVIEISFLQWHNKYAYDMFNFALIINIFSFIIIFKLDKESIINDKINIKTNLFLFIVTLFLIMTEACMICFVKEVNVGLIYMIMLYVVYLFLIVINCNVNVIDSLHIVSIGSCLSYLINQIHTFFISINDINLMILKGLLIYASGSFFSLSIRYIHKIKRINKTDSM